jgi:hypothetical protein
LVGELNETILIILHLLKDITMVCLDNQKKAQNGESEMVFGVTFRIDGKFILMRVG